MIYLMFTFLFVSVILLIGNERIYKWRIAYLQEETNYIIQRIHSLRDSELMYRRFNALPSYHRMMFEFWKPLKGYYKELDEFYS